MLFIRDLWLDMKGILRVTRQMINAQLEPLGLTGAQGDILFHLLTGSDGFQQEQLAEQLDVGKAVISRAIDALEAMGHVARVRQQADKRAYSVCLTEKGLSLRAAVEGVYGRLYTLAKQGIADEELLRFQSALARVSDNLTSLGEESC